MNDVIQAALSYVAQGFKIFPVKPDKKPLTPHGLKDATQTQSGVREYWTRWPDAGIALVTDGLMVLDFDAKNRGLESKVDMETKYGSLPRTRTPIETVLNRTTNANGFLAIKVIEAMVYF